MALDGWAVVFSTVMRCLDVWYIHLACCLLHLQKGDFVIERKDVWKTEGFPIWRIETGKLLQKFDPLLTDSGIIHKSASVVSA